MTEDAKMKQPAIRVGISSCLLGEKVRYDGGHKLDRFLRDTLGQYVQYVPVCPEVECGLGVPREPMHLVEDPDSLRLVTRESGVDLTGRMNRWCHKKIIEFERDNLSSFIFKSRSPSCGTRDVKILSKSGAGEQTGAGIFARFLMDRYPEIHVEESDRLQDPAIREQFMEMLLGLKPGL